MDALKIFKTALLLCSGLITPIWFGTKLIIYDCSSKISLGGHISAWHGPRNAHYVRLLKNHGEETETVIFPTPKCLRRSLHHTKQGGSISPIKISLDLLQVQTVPYALSVMWQLRISLL